MSPVPEDSGRRVLAGLSGIQPGPTGPEPPLGDTGRPGHFADAPGGPGERLMGSARVR